MRALITALFSMLLAWPCMAVDGQTNDSTLLAKADTLHAHGKCKDALRIYNDLIERHALEVRALVGRSECTKDIDACFADLQRALTLAPNDPGAHFTRAMLYEALKMYDRSLLDLDEVIAHYADSTMLVHAWNQQAWCHLNTRNFDRALDLTGMVLTADSSNLRAVNTRAVVLEEIGRVDEALAEMKHFIRLKPDAVEGYLNTAFFLSKHGRYQEALVYYDQMEPKAKNDPLYLNNRGYTRLKLGDLKGALKDIQRSIDIMPGNSYAYRNLGLTYKAMDRHDDACTAFEKALSLGFTGQYGDEVQTEHAAYCR